MFSQFRHAVETFAPQPRRSTEDSVYNDGRSSLPTRSNSVDVAPTQLTEGALSSLRRSFSPQLSGAPTSPQKSPRPHKSTLEERLRAAAFTIGEASHSATPLPSNRSSPAPLVSKDQALSPASIPLPESPVKAQDPLEVLSIDAKGLQPQEKPSEDENPGRSSLATEPKGDTEVAKETNFPVNENAFEVSSEFEAQTTAVEAVPAQEMEQGLGEDVQDMSQVVDDLAPVPADEKIHATEVLSLDISTSGTVEELQQRLKLVEQRFADISVSFKRLQAEKSAADAVLRELTPLETVRESDALRDYLKNIVLKVELSQDEIKRLNTKLQVQDGRIEELRDTHRLESKSQTDQIDTLKKQLEESELLLKASQGSLDNHEKLKAENERLNEEVLKGKELVKDEEEKRAKAISLLKTVRQKLAKAEKDRDDATKEILVLKEKEKGREETEKAKHQSEIESINAERDKAIGSLKAQLEKEIAAAKERHDRELTSVRAALELDAVTVKATHEKEISSRNTRITQLENSLNAVVRDKNSFFEQVQLRQAEAESSQAHLESLQSQNAEFQHQLREHEDRIVLLNEELLEARRREHESTSKDSASSADTARLLAAVEAKYESKLVELKRVLNNAEKERNESDAEWSRKLREKNKETERLNRLLGTATQTKAQDEGIAEDLKVEVSRLQEQLRANQNEISSLDHHIAQLKDNENSAAAREKEIETKLKIVEQNIEEGKSRESQLRANNKTLREELRKVQSSAALLDRQRNPGVGYWTSRTEITPQLVSASSDPVVSAGTPGRTSTEKAPPSKEEEEVNLEYLRNVILQFLEHKEMRPNLVRVLSIILHFTPQETRRLIAKV